MNAKLCKKLRQAARRLTVGKPKSRLLAKEGKDQFNRPCVSAVNDPASTRGVYRNLKKSVRRAEARL